MKAKIRIGNVRIELEGNVDEIIEIVEPFAMEEQLRGEELKEDAEEIEIEYGKGQKRLFSKEIDDWLRSDDEKIEEEMQAKKTKSKAKKTKAKAKKKTKKNKFGGGHNLSWKKEEDMFLRDFKNQKAKDLARMLNRTADSVALRRWQLKNNKV